MAAVFCSLVFEAMPKPPDEAQSDSQVDKPRQALTAARLGNVIKIIGSSSWPSDFAAIDLVHHPKVEDRHHDPWDSQDSYGARRGKPSRRRTALSVTVSSSPRSCQARFLLVPV